jgi:hypothetical protein
LQWLNYSDTVINTPAEQERGTPNKHACRDNKRMIVVIITTTTKSSFLETIECKAPYDGQFRPIHLLNNFINSLSDF